MIEVLGAGLCLHKFRVILGQMIVNWLDAAPSDEQWQFHATGLDARRGFAENLPTAFAMHFSAG